MHLLWFCPLPFWLQLDVFLIQWPILCAVEQSGEWRWQYPKGIHVIVFLFRSDMSTLTSMNRYWCRLSIEEYEELLHWHTSNVCIMFFIMCRYVYWSSICSSTHMILFSSSVLYNRSQIGIIYQLNPFILFLLPYRYITHLQNIKVQTFYRKAIFSAHLSPVAFIQFS